MTRQRQKSKSAEVEKQQGPLFSFFLSFYFFLLNKEKCMAWGLVAIPHIHRVSDTTRQTQWNLAWGSPKQYNS